MINLYIRFLQTAKVSPLSLYRLFVAGEINSLRMIQIRRVVTTLGSSDLEVDDFLISLRKSFIVALFL